MKGGIVEGRKFMVIEELLMIMRFLILLGIYGIFISGYKVNL